MFVEKLNKKQEGFYVIEEEKAIQDGKWEGYLEHDNVNRESIVIYTGPNFTGTKVDNFFVSIPSEMPWKTYLKVFSNSEKIYITYESQGDQVEAEDINLLQNTLVDEINRAKTEEKRIEERLNDEITRAITEDERLDVEVNKKANKTYVDTELNKRYTKDEVFNKQEVLQKIQDLIGTAPEALDTLAEIADALNNDPDFAATVTNLLSQKVDKVAGKGLSTEDYTTAEKQKLAGIEEGANKYVHPSTHPASMITESTTKRFVSDTEKANWNGKADISDIPTKVGQLENDKNYVTQAELGNAGYGDMSKEVYDKNNDGKVDRAELADNVPWSGVTGKPSTFPPNSHKHDYLSIPDTRGDENSPLDYMSSGRSIRAEFKYRNSVGNPPVNASASSTYAHILTITGWSNSSGGYPVQITFGKKSIAVRIGVSDTSWGSWTEYRTLTGGLTWNDLKGV